MRILHLTDRLTDRGGAHWHLLGVMRRLVEVYEAVRDGRSLFRDGPGDRPPEDRLAS